MSGWEYQTSSKMANSFDDEFCDNFEESTSFLEKLKATFRLLVILASYSVSFVSVVQFGIWLAPGRTNDYTNEATIQDWSYELVTRLNWRDPNLLNLLLDTFLLLIFAFQHTLMSSRVLRTTRHWHFIHFTCQIDKPLYLFFTGLTLQVLKHYWITIPIFAWKSETLLELSDILKGIHIFAWVVLYGTSLMLDLPEMIGLTEVAISSPTVTAKSPDLQSLHTKQRHMGLIPFILILFCVPCMSLDRLLLTLCTVYYMNRQWSSESCYEYTRNMRKAKKFTL